MGRPEYQLGLLVDPLSSSPLLDVNLLGVEVLKGEEIEEDEEAYDSERLGLAPAREGH